MPTCIKANFCLLMFSVCLQVSLSQQTTQTSDVFSFGVIMQQMLSGATPWIRTAANDNQDSCGDAVASDSNRRDGGQAAEEATANVDEDGQLKQQQRKPQQQQQQLGFRANPTFWQLPAHTQPPGQYLHLRNRCEVNTVVCCAAPDGA
jgi:hypothetical protein